MVAWSDTHTHTHTHTERERERERFRRGAKLETCNVLGFHRVTAHLGAEREREGGRLGERSIH